MSVKSRPPRSAADSLIQKLGWVSVNPATLSISLELHYGHVEDQEPLDVHNSLGYLEFFF